MTRSRAIAALIALLAASHAPPALAQRCTRDGARVACDDGRTGAFTGDAIVWPNGTRSSRAPHPSLHVGNRQALSVGPGVFVGSPGGGRGVVPLDDPNDPNKRGCALLDDVPYCH